MPPQDGRTDVSKFPPVFYRTSALWGRCPALTPPLHWTTTSRALGTADHVRSLDDLLFPSLKICSQHIFKPDRLSSPTAGASRDVPEVPCHTSLSHVMRIHQWMDRQSDGPSERNRNRPMSDRQRDSLREIFLHCLP